MNWIIVAVVVLMAQREYLASPTPLKLPGHTQRLSPYIRHWEAANFDRAPLHDAHHRHLEQKRHRRKRDLQAGEYGPAHTIRLNFYAHDREFRLVLRQDPLSVFAGDVEIENSLGPMDYDISRIYTGSLEDDENSHVHAVLTTDNLLDGTIETSAEQFYVEPAHRYSPDLAASGIHSIVYRVSDVSMQNPAAASSPIQSSAAGHCASERLRRSVLAERQVDIAGNLSAGRVKRWLPDELPVGEADRGNPPLPLDLEVPYNDDFSIFTHARSRERTPTERERERKVQQANVVTWRTSFTPSSIATKATRNRNIIVNTYTPPGESTNSNTGSSSNGNGNGNGDGNSSNSNNNSVRKTYTKHKNIIVSTYNNNNNNNNNNYKRDREREREQEGGGSFPVYESPDDVVNGLSGTADFANNFFNTNWTTMFAGSERDGDRPSHKTHVEIITKNGATKKPNIIVNNYNPEIMMAPNPHHPNFNNMLLTNLLSGRGGLDGGNEAASSSPRSLYDRKITCMLYLQADHTFFQKMGTDEASIEAITRHVQRANSIYKNTDFNNDGKPDNITFMIKRIKVHNMNAIKDPSYRFPGNYGVEKFLELFSEEDYDAFCLAYMFTYRDFEMGTLGLAWTGDLKNAGGVCEKNGHYRGSLKSLNTGIVTLLNYGKHVPPAVSHVTLAHEIGHNFGSPHDPEQCTPGGEDGNYIMFARATSGDKRNNNKFSPCSLKSIEPVLNAKARSAKGCFTEPQTSICGNGVVEQGEQCDCGWEEDCKDSCCFPMSRHPRIDEKPCTLTPHAMCSPSQGPCCTTDCKLKFGDKCRDDNGCRDPSYCDGRMPQCPPSVNKPNKTICNKEFVCYMGDCTGSICLAYGLESCQCIPGPDDDKIKSCELCCKLPGEDNPCRSSFEWNEPPFDVPDMYAKPGTPCNDYNGYCDVFQKCREVDPSGPLATLRKLLLSEESIATFKKWVQHNWYTVALAAVGVFVLLVLSTKMLAKRSNLKLKSVTIIHSATTETVRLPDDNNGVIVHTAVRTKVPFKKKVRGERSTAKAGVALTGAGKLKKSSSSSKAIKASANTTHAHRNTNANVTTAGVEVKKPIRTKKNRVAGNVAPPSPPSNSSTTAVVNVEKPVDTKKAKKFRKRSKEIIDYSARNKNASSAAAQAIASAHTNTFGKVQKWLLESPIVAQPLSHIEHSSKVRKVMSKSHSTPERLVQKSPQKTKSVGNLAGEKVKLQVVYKPPFKFSLRLSKNAKVKTHVVGGAAAASGNKLKRLARPTANQDLKRQTSKQSTTAEVPKAASAEKTKRAALLLCGSNEEDNQILTLNEPNYETLNPKNMPSKVENPFYENVQYNQVEPVAKVNRSSSKTNMEPLASANASVNNNSNNNSSTVGNEVPSQTPATQNPRSYSRSQSLSAGNPFGVAHNRGSRKLSDANATNLNRNFGSTQNLINSSQTNLAKSKKRSSLNLKAGITKSGKDPPHVLQTKRSNSNLNLHRDNSASNLPNELRRNSSSNAHLLPASLTPVASGSRSSFANGNNIPRVSLGASIGSHGHGGIAFSRPGATAVNEQRRSRGANPLRQQPVKHVLPQLPLSTSATASSNTNASASASSNCNSNSSRSEMPGSDLEIAVSDVENLVS